MSSHYVTRLADPRLSKKNLGDAVTLTASGKAGLGSAGDTLIGRIFKYEDDGYLAVQDRGPATFRGVPGRLPKESDSVVLTVAERSFP